MSRNDPSTWPALDFNDEYAAGMAYSRLTMIFNQDPYMLILDKSTRDAIANLIFSDEVLGSANIKAVTRAEIVYSVVEALSKSPIALLFTDKFKWYISGLVTTVLFAGKE